MFFWWQILFHLRIRSVPLNIRYGEVLALHNKDVELSQFLHVVNGELDCAFDLHITKLTTVDAHYTASNLQIPRTKTQIYTETFSLLDVINVCKK